MISVFTPTKDRPAWLPRCIASVRAQSLSDFEHVVYDNGSQSVEHLVPDDPHVRYVRGPATGPADAFQRALELTRGEIVHPLSDDDQLTPDALEVVDREIGEYEWLHGLTAVEDRQGNLLDTIGAPVHLGRLRKGYYLGGAVYWKRSLSDRLGGFMGEYDGAADYQLYLRFARSSIPKFVDQVLYRYCDWPGTDSRKQVKRQGDASERIRKAA